MRQKKDSTKRKLHDLLISEENAIPIEKAIDNAKKKYKNIENRDP